MDLTLPRLRPVSLRRPRRRPGRRGRLLAEGIERAVERADAGHRPAWSPVVPPAPEAAGEARAALLELADRLRHPRPVSAEGLRRARALQTDGNGPLYAPAHPGALRQAAAEILELLDGVTPAAAPAPASPPAPRPSSRSARHPRHGAPRRSS